MRLLGGIFIGGAARRMGGFPKGLLPDPAEGLPLVARLAELLRQIGADCVLVGERPEYQALGLAMLPDSPPGIGPLGGLAALMEAAHANKNSGVLALACDLPAVPLPLLCRLADGSSSDDYDALAPRQPDVGRWEALCARYQPTALPGLRQTLASGERSLQALFRRLRVQELKTTDAERRSLTDWDEPGDLPPGLRPYS